MLTLKHTATFSWKPHENEMNEDINVGNKANNTSILSMLKSHLSGNESEERPLQLDPYFLSCDKQHVGALWFDNMIWFQQWLRSFSMEGDVTQQDNLTCLLRMFAPFQLGFHLWG